MSTPICPLASPDSASNLSTFEGEADAAGAASRAARQQRMAAAVRTLLECLGEDPEREGLLDTPTRVTKSLLSLTDGYAKVRACCSAPLAPPPHDSAPPPNLSRPHPSARRPPRRPRATLWATPCSSPAAGRWWW